QSLASGGSALAQCDLEWRHVGVSGESRVASGACVAAIFAIPFFRLLKLSAPKRVHDESSLDCDSVLVAGGAFCGAADDLDLAIHQVRPSAEGRALSQVRL